jgi:M6 family metalloprotease-like protein
MNFARRLVVALVVLTVASISSAPGQTTGSEAEAEAVARDGSASGTAACKLPDVSPDLYGRRRIWVGFPLTTNNIQPTDDVRVVVLPVDMPDVPGTDDPFANIKFHVEAFTEYYTTMSRGRLRFTVDYVRDYVRLPRATAAYQQTSPSDYNALLVQDAVDAADATVDFTGTKILILWYPPGQTFAGASSQGFRELLRHPPIMSNEGEIWNYMAAGPYFTEIDNHEAWMYYVHETAHMLGLPDYYLNSEQGGGTYPIPGGPYSHWDVMASDGPSRTISSWSRWLLGWLEDNQVFCKPAQTIDPDTALDVTLRPLDADVAGFKALMIPTSDHTAIVVESRRPIGPDVGLKRWTTVGRPPRGVLVYRVDTSIGHGEGFASLIIPEGRRLESLYWSNRTPRSLDALLNVGDTVTADGLTITLQKRNTLRVSRSTAVPNAPRTLRATAGDRQVTLKWKAPAGTPVTAYRIQQSFNDGVWVTVVPNLSSVSTKHTIRRLLGGGRYRFRVAAASPLATSTYSTPVDVVPQTASRNVQSSKMGS